MREIKFRCWDTRKELNPVSGNGIMWYQDDETVTIEDCYNIAKIHGGVLMQYTGLHDKNKKEIWEGDIVKWIGSYGIYAGEFLIGVIEWGEGCFFLSQKNYPDKWQISKNFEEWPDWEDPSFYDIVGESCFSWSKVEVIGNIYQHPGLLKEVSHD